MSPLNRLTLAASGLHIADQSALVAVPLVAALVFGADAAMIGVLVACQSLAHLLGSLPFGVLVDQSDARRTALGACAISFIGAIGAAASVSAGQLFGFGLSITIAGFGIVLFGLSVLSIIPRLVQPSDLARANARIETPRAWASFGVPLLVATLLTQANAQALFVLAALAAGIAGFSLARLPTFAPQPSAPEPILRRISQGARFVRGHALLLPISLCAVFWNMAFSALLVTTLPFLTQTLQAPENSFGVALAAFGLGGIFGLWVSGKTATRLRPSFVLLFGPALSVVAALGLLLIPDRAANSALYTCFFMLGFGPSMWLVAQNSVRQLVTPAAMLGRVNAVIQTAIYGVRPLGALMGGLIVSATSPRMGLAFVAAGFAASFAASFFSGLRHVNDYTALTRAPLDR